MTSATPKPRAGEHTRGPWRLRKVNSGASLVEAGNERGPFHNGESFSIQLNDANARRIVACVNALEGVSLEAIENGGRTGSVMQALGIERDRAKTLLEATQRQYIEAKTERDSLAAQNRELIEALKMAAHFLEPRGAIASLAPGSDAAHLPKKLLALLAKHGR